MEEAGFELIANYLKDLEEGLVELDYRGISTLADLNLLYEILAYLNQVQDHRLLPLLLALKSKAVRCKNCIEHRLAVLN